MTLVFKFQLLPRTEGFQLPIPLEAFTSTQCIKAVIERLKNMTFPIILCHSYIYFLSCLSNSCVCLRVLGTIAEREHRKWESAPPLPNNPYSPENINKRLSRQSTGFSSRSSSVASMWVLAGWVWNVTEPHLDASDVRTSAGKHFLRGSILVFVAIINNIHRCIQGYS